MRILVRIVAIMQDYEIEVDQNMKIEEMLDALKQINQAYDLYFKYCYHKQYQILDNHKTFKQYPYLEYDLLWLF